MLTLMRVLMLMQMLIPMLMLMLILMLMLMRSEVGGSEYCVSPPPNREIDFGFGCDCVACVRASERSCVREMIPLWLGLGARICGGPGPVRPPATLNKKVEQ